MAKDRQRAEVGSQLSPRALADLDRSALDASDAQRLGITPVRTAFGTSDNYRLPYFELDGKRNCFYRDKIFDDPAGKYHQPKGSTPRFYLVPDVPWESIATDVAKPLLIVEGEKKAACACKSGFPTVGIGGVWNWMSKGKPIADLDLITWEGRTVHIAYDSDKAQKPDVLRAQEALAVELSGRGSDVRIVDLPAEGDDKVGLDDFLVAQGAAALRALIARATPFAEPITEMNKKHFVVMVGGKCLIGTELHDPAFGRPDLQLSSPHDLRHLYANRRVPVGHNRSTNLGDAWLSSPRRRELKSIVFAPGRDMPDHYNLWRGFAVEPREGDYSLYLDHIRDNVCGGSRELYDYVISWMADAVQNPAQLPGVAIVLRGKQGTGKGVAAAEFGKLFGRHFLRLSNPRHLVGNFNAHAKDALILFADEAFWAGDKSAEGTLKALVTEETRLVEYKGKDAFPVRNYTRLIIASNHDWVVPAGMEERRFCVIDVGDARMQDHDYFARIVQQMENGGREALLHYLMHYDTTRVNLRALPRTAALTETKLRSLTSTEAFVFNLLQSAEADEWQPEIPRAVLHRRYVEYAKDAGDRHRATETELGMTLRKLIPDIRTKQRRVGTTHHQVRHYAFPPLAECRGAFERAINAALDWQAADPAAPRRGRGQ